MWANWSLKVLIAHMGRSVLKRSNTMAEVDIGSLFIMTVPPNEVLFGGQYIAGTSSIEVYWGADIAPGQWFQAALHISPNQPGTSAAITSQGPMMDGNGSTGLGLTVTNFSPITQNNFSLPVEVSINVLSSPAHGF
jgi:hypothetical protein